ncbi:hypothetical protein PAV_11c00110 [Paenibacillus alvei DSM 29]|uniref:hypothetical protein n=1 Tax=Paenibacillus alvei TaxID=44250 RepID=UPI00028888CC|nr:hypothetical protein PAV_11c00110 [Paenibacillus alvei DSM 29]
MSTNTTLPVSREAVAALSSRKSEPAWLAELRLQALDQAAALDYPIFEKQKLNAGIFKHMVSM